MRKYPLLDLISPIPFGKHKGTTIQSIINDEPDYILFLNEKGIQFSKRALNLAKVTNKNKKYPIFKRKESPSLETPP
jgi:hypothetical protein